MYGNNNEILKPKLTPRFTIKVLTRQMKLITYVKIILTIEEK